MKYKKLLKFFIISLSLSCLSGGGLSLSAYGSPVSIAQSHPFVKVFPGRVEITVPDDEPRSVVIYSLTGQVIKTISAQPGTNSIELSPGYYIIKMDRISTRVVVK